MEVRFYHFSKKPNSTKIPTDGGTVYSCTLKSASGIINPIVRLMLPIGSNPSAFNYAYIPDYGRYYYVRDWVFSDRLWDGSLHVDALASWKNAIGSTELYALRSSAKSDGTIYDNFYPTKDETTETITEVQSPWVRTTGGTAIDISTGCYMVGVVSNAPDIGSIQYCFFSQSNLASFCSNLMAVVSTSNGFDADDASMALQKSLIDPLSYIKSCTWLPILYESINTTEISVIYAGGFSISATYKTMGSKKTAPFFGGIARFTLHDHPQISRGSFLNLNPYKNAWLHIPPFGCVDIDLTKYINASYVELRYYLDYVTGSAEALIYSGNSIVQRISAQVGVPVQLSEIRQNIINGTLSTIGNIAGGLLSAFTGNIGGAISGGLSAIGSATDTIKPQVSSIGGSGSFSDLNGSWQMTEQFFEIADEDNGHHGRPLCRNVKPADLGGYLLIADGDISIPGTSEEIQTIKSTLEGGFFFE